MRTTSMYRLDRRVIRVVAGERSGERWSINLRMRLQMIGMMIDGGKFERRKTDSEYGTGIDYAA